MAMCRSLPAEFLRADKPVFQAIDLPCQMPVAGDGRVTLRVGPRRPAIALMAIAICAQLGCRHDQPPQPWHGLSHRSGWVLLGVRDTRDGNWAVAPQFEIEGVTTEAWPATRDPRTGELLALTANNDLVILEYATRGEDRRLDFPGGRRLDTGDIAAKLVAGERLHVDEIIAERPVDTLLGVWARVGPPDR